MFGDRRPIAAGSGERSSGRYLLAGAATINATPAGDVEFAQIMTGDVHFVALTAIVKPNDKSGWIASIDR